MSESKEDLIAYRLSNGCDMRLVAATGKRPWMDESNAGFANRCLPMRIAGQAGWFILNDRTLRARWNGESAPGAVVIERGGGLPPYAATSHFGEGILTFSLPYLFRTPPGVSLLIRGPANSPKDAVSPLEGLVETDWSVAGISMNWKITRADTWVEFARDEPIAMIVPYCLDRLETIIPQCREIRDDAELYQHFLAWRESCRSFNERLSTNDPEAIRLGWQKYYFRGSAPPAGGVPVKAERHRTELKLFEFVKRV